MNEAENAAYDQGYTDGHKAARELGPTLGLNALAQAAHKIAVAHGFDEVRFDEWDRTDYDAAFIVPTKLALIHSEVSEALEEFRKEHRLLKFGEELADVIIRTLNLSHALGIDMDAIVAQKQAANGARPYKHGGRRI